MRDAPISWAWTADHTALLLLAAVTVFATVLLFYGGAMIGQDSATQFYPWYDYLGERLKAGDIPGWNPYQFGGAPFAADPQSGWMYLPAMAIFTVLPMGQAVQAFILFHLAVAGFAMYALARALGLGPGGALVAGIGYQLAGPIYGRSVCCPAALEVATWAPVALLGAELAMRRSDWRGRMFGWAIAGLAVSQGLAAWLGQGAYYLLLALGAFIAWRTLLAPHRPARWTTRMKLAFLHGGAILSLGFGLAAAAVLPRLEYVARSNVDAGEYRGHNAWAAEIGGVTPSMAFDHFLDPTLHYAGAAILVLTLLAFYLARRWQGFPFFFGFGVVVFVLAMPVRTPIHQFFYLLPRFEALHQHWPERISVVGFMSGALLAGASVDGLVRGGFRRRSLVIAAVAPLAVLLVLLGLGSTVPLAAAGVIVAVGAIMVAASVKRLEPLRWVLPIVLAAVVAADLLWAFQSVAAQAPYGGYHRVDLTEYYAPSGAVAYLRERTADEPGRYIGYDPAQRARADDQTVLYRYQFVDDETEAILVNNRGTLHGLEDIQGYNPVQPRAFVEYLTALNGHSQEYHDANVYAAGLTSPLLDLLNVRYILVPTAATERADMQQLLATYPTVYLDDQVRILENQEALPRAWIVHEVMEVAPGDALAALTSGMVDPRATALVEGRAPRLDPVPDGTVESSRVLLDETDRLRVNVEMQSAGLLVLSETYDPGWKAYVDGKPARILEVDHLLRGVALSPGDHIVELRYAPLSLQFGLALTIITMGAFAVTWVMVGRRRWLADDEYATSMDERLRTAEGTSLAQVEAARLSQSGYLWMQIK